MFQLIINHSHNLISICIVKNQNQYQYEIKVNYVVIFNTTNKKLYFCEYLSKNCRFNLGYIL